MAPGRRPFRCRGFDDRGNPIGAGCRRRNNGMDCHFTHPDDPEWETAPTGRGPPPDTRREPYDNRRDSFDNRRPDIGYGSRPKQRTPPPDPPTSTWGSSSAKGDSTQPSAWDSIKNDSSAANASGSWSTSGGSGDWSRGTGGWGTGGSSWAAGSSVWGTGSSGQSSTARNESTAKEKEADDSHKGTDKTADTPASTSQATSWGETSKSGPTEGPSRNIGQSEWNTGSSSSSWSAVAASVPADPDAMEVDDDASKKSRPTPQVDTTFQNRQVDESPAPSTPLPQSATSRKGRMLPPIRTSVTPGPEPGQSPLLSAQTPKNKYFSGLGLESAALSVLADGSKLRPSTSGSSTPTTGSVRGLDVPSYDGPGGASRLYTDTIKALRNVSISEVVYQRAVKVNDQQRAMQKANVYSNATTATREKLEETRVRWATKLSNLKSKRDEKLAVLLSLPDLSAMLTAKIMGPMETKEAIMGYTQELQSWMEEIELHRRLLLEEKEIKERKPEKPLLVAAENQPTQPRESPEPETLLPPLLAKKSWTWKDMLDAASMLQAVIEKTRESVFTQLYTKQPELDTESIDSIRQAINQELEDELIPLFNLQDLYADEIGQTSSSINHMGEEVQEQAGDVANLLQKITNLEQELKTLQDEYTEIEEVISHAEAQFPQFDIMAQRDAENIQALTAKLQTLHLRKEHSAKAPAPLPPPQPVDISQISGLIQPGVKTIIIDQLNPILEALVEKCRQNQTDLLSQLELLIQPLNEETDRLLNLPS